MTMPKNISRAEKAIAGMPYGFWVDIRSIARNARAPCGSDVPDAADASKAVCHNP